mmetsp:Transcript_100460/g.292834  ORF Transcript_100460/g.292834 Transcript_100460/m.292834 type:complete len:255 (+) Transcript_100460:1-765(+)
MGLSAFSTGLHHQCVSTPAPEGGTTGAPAASSAPATAGAPVVVVKPVGVDGPVQHDLPNGTAGAVNREAGNATNGTSVAGGEVGGGIPSWVWIILAIMLLVCVPVLGYFLFCTETAKKGKSAKKKKKSKRGVPRDESNEDSFVTNASELEMQQPLVRGQDRSANLGQGPELFDLLDANHDGIISQNEFNAAMGTTASMRATPVNVMQGSMNTAAAPVAQMRPGMPGVVTISPYGANIQYPQGANVQYMQPGMFR